MPRFVGVRRALLISGVSLSLLASLAVPAATAEQGSLPALEEQIATSPGLLADQLAIQAASDDIRTARDRAGLSFTYANDIGPEAVIVPYNVDEHVLRFEQTAGIKAPILGSRTVQDLLIADAERREQIAKIAMNAAYRDKLAQLREAYVRYWTARLDADIANVYLAGANDERPQALALLRRGFWTQTEFLDYSTTVSTVSAQDNEDRNEASAQLALIASSIGRPVELFDPAPPQFFDGCKPDRGLAIASAYAVDASLAQLQAESEIVALQLGRVRGSGIDASVQARAGSRTDINHRVSGYDLLTGIDVSLPMHLRDEERADRAKYQAELQQIALEVQQRKVEIAASLDAAIAQIGGDDLTLANARLVQQDRQRDYQIAVAQFNTVKQPPEHAFSDVHAKLDALYVSNRAVSASESDRLLKANELLKLAPGACGGIYEKIAPFKLVIKAPSRKNKTRSPSPRSR